jgi:ribonuclease BN (tRNA processing enzyme)
MEIIILGSGTAIPMSNRASPSFVLLSGEQLVLFDMGPGTLRQLSRTGMSHEEIEHIIISHFHPDHTADLIHFLFATRIPSTLKRRKPFTIVGPLGLGDFLKRLQKAYGRWLRIPPEIMGIRELATQKPETLTHHAFDLISQPTRHTPDSLAYRVEGLSGKSFVYSGDTGFCEEIVELARGTDLLILECSFPDGEAVEGHLTPALAGRIADLAGVNRLVLIHFYPQVLTTDIASQCRRTYSGELILGRDLLHLRV